jgi:acyl-coenzyme A thioesterase PaaI-like protein
VRSITKDTGIIRAEGRIIHRGRTIATSEGDVRDRAGTLYAHATTTCAIFPPKGGG